MNNIAPRVKIIINNAVKEAKNFGDVKIRPEHITLAIINEKNSIVENALKKINVDLDEFFDEISNYLNNDTTIPRIHTGNRTVLPFSEETTIILKKVQRECDAMGDNLIDIQHLLLAILSSKTYTTTKFNDMGLAYSDLKTILLEMKNETNNNFMNENISENDENDGKFKKKNDNSKTPVLDNFCRDISKMVMMNQIDPVIGRDKEIRRMSQILSRRKKNNPILIGNPGVGKCICSDTKVILRNDETGEVFEIEIKDFLNNITNP